MTPSDDIRAALRASGGVICRRDHPRLLGTIDRAVRVGRLTAVLPGVYAPSWLAGLAETRVRAVAAKHRDAVLVGAAAARLTNCNAERMRLLVDSRDRPWSAAERLAHRLLRQAGITGWSSNVAVRIDGFLYYIDMAVRARKLAFEIDGRLHETNEDLFQSDRWRQNALVLDGWQVLRFTWEMLRDHPEEFIAAVRFAMR